MKARLISEQTRFNFDKQPLDRYKPHKGPSIYGGNPRKQRTGELSSEEEKIIERHRNRILELEDEIENYDNEIDSLEREIEEFQSGVDPSEQEQVDGEIIERWGWDMLDLLNSGMPDEKKLKEMMELQKKGNDTGEDADQDLLDYYNEYHPIEEDYEEEIEEINEKIEKIKVQRRERENTVEKLYNKIRNIENY